MIPPRSLEVGTAAEAENAVRSALLNSGEGGHDRSVSVSVIVPVAERPEPLSDLYREFAPLLEQCEGRYEFVFISGPNWTHLLEPLRDLVRAGDPILLLSVGQDVDESTLLKLALQRCGGEIVLTLPSYRRIVPEGLPVLVRSVQAGADLVTARRAPRADSLFNRAQSWLFQTLVNTVAPQRVEDLGCGVRAMRREVLQRVELYGDFHRFLPILAARDGFRVRVVDVSQHPGDVGPKVYGPGVYLRRLLDLLGIFFVARFTYKPLRFFGLLGSFISAVGCLILIGLMVQRLLGQGIADRPALLLGLLLVMLGVQAVALGLVGEIIVYFNAPKRLGYRVLDDTSTDSRTTQSS